MSETVFYPNKFLDVNQKVKKENKKEEDNKSKIRENSTDLKHCRSVELLPSALKSTRKHINMLYTASKHHPLTHTSACI